MKAHDMLISVCNRLPCITTGVTKRVIRCFIGDAKSCQKKERTEPLNGSTMPKAMVLSLAQRVKMCLSTTAPLLVTVIALFLKVRKWSLLPHVATKDGKRQKFQRLKALEVTRFCLDSFKLSINPPGCGCISNRYTKVGL